MFPLRVMELCAERDSQKSTCFSRNVQYIVVWISLGGQLSQAYFVTSRVSCASIGQATGFRLSCQRDFFYFISHLLLKDRNLLRPIWSLLIVQAITGMHRFEPKLPNVSKYYAATLNACLGDVLLCIISRWKGLAHANCHTRCGVSTSADRRYHSSDWEISERRNRFFLSCDGH